MYVSVKLQKTTKDFHIRGFERIRTEVAKQGLGDNATPTLMAYEGPGVVYPHMDGPIAQPA